MDLFLLLSLALIIFSVYLAQAMAKRKGLDPRVWGILGALFGPLILPFIIFSKSRKPPTDSH